MIPESLNEVDEIPAKIVDMVHQSVINTFSSIIGDEPEKIGGDLGNEPLNGIIGNISVFNPVHTLSLMLAIPKETAMGLSEVFVGMELPFESEDMGDLIGELSNILAGEVAANIEKVGFRGQSSLPTPTRGSDMTLFMPNKPPTEKIRYTSSKGEFWLNMVLSESKS